MIVVKLKEGLGNQLFQYAVARHLAYLHNVPLKLDISSFTRNPLRTYQLNHFNITGEIATASDLPWVKRSDLLGKIARRIDQRWPYYRRAWLKEQQWYQFDANIFRSPRHLYLDGFWQSEKYFQAIAAIIRREFTLHAEPTGVNRAIGTQIAGTDSISLHVRRGDYIANPHFNQLFGICSLAYYAAAIQKVTTFVPHPHFFIFSDDPTWAQNNLKVAYPMTVLTHNGPAEAYEDLRLMSLCKHHIIANSSFSWWGAWLNPNPAKVVIAPRQWLQGASLDTHDLLPERWLKI